MTGSIAPIQSAPLPADDPTRRNPDISRARCLLDWEPIVALEAGLRATIDDFRLRSGRNPWSVSTGPANGVSEAAAGDQRWPETSGDQEL